MRAVLGCRHPAVANFQHVGIVPMARPGVRFEPVLKIENMDHAHAAPIALAVPAVLDVASRAPEIAYVPGPQPRFRRAPFADAENNRPSRFQQSVAHDRIRRSRVLRARRAPVVLQIINTPRRILSRVLKFITAASRTLLAGERARVGVDAKLQTFRMNVISERFHARRKSLRIGEYVSLRVATDLPTVVDHEVNITGVAHAARDHRIGHLLDELLTDVATKLVPTVPAHWRRFGEAVVERIDIRYREHEEQSR